MPTIPEKDWKTLRAMKDDLLQKACGQILDKISKFIEESPDDKHTTYRKLWKTMKQEDGKIANMLDDMRRSNARFKLGCWYGYGLIDDETLQQFSEDTRQSVQSIFEITFDGEKDNVGQ